MTGTDALPVGAGFGIPVMIVTGMIVGNALHYLLFSRTIQVPLPRARQKPLGGIRKDQKYGQDDMDDLLQHKAIPATAAKNPQS